MAKEDDNYKYPLLMKGIQSGRLIRMVAYGKGTVIGSGHKGCGKRIGEYSDGWAMHNFKPYKG